MTEETLLKTRAEIKIITKSKEELTRRNVRVLPAMDLCRTAARSSGSFVTFHDNQIRQAFSQEILFELNVEIISTQEFRDNLNTANQSNCQVVDYGQKIVDDFLKIEESPTPAPPVISMVEEASSLDSMVTNASVSGSRPISAILNEFDALVVRSEGSSRSVSFRPISPAVRFAATLSPAPPSSSSSSPTLTPADWEDALRRLRDARSPSYSPRSPDYIPTYRINSPNHVNDQRVAQLETTSVQNEQNSLLNTPSPSLLDDGDDIEIIDIVGNGQNDEADDDEIPNF